MTHPTTDQSIRERLARAAYPEWFGESGKLFSNYPGQDKSYQKRAFQKVDAILAELQEPSAAMLREGDVWDGLEHLAPGLPPSSVEIAESWRRMIQHIRAGGK